MADKDQLAAEEEKQQIEMFKVKKLIQCVLPLISRPSLYAQGGSPRIALPCPALSFSVSGSVALCLALVL
eukprot:COSAG02_NODE_19211_length_894_cov_1.293082_1_plen_70_part_00